MVFVGYVAKLFLSIFVRFMVPLLWYSIEAIRARARMLPLPWEDPLCGEASIATKVTQNIELLIFLRALPVASWLKELFFGQELREP